MRRHHFIGEFREEAPFYKLFQGGGTNSLGKFGRRLVEFFYLCPKLYSRLAGVSFCGPCFTWRANHLDQDILLVWPNLCFYCSFFFLLDCSYVLLCKRGIIPSAY